MTGMAGACTRAAAALALNKVAGVAKEPASSNTYETVEVYCLLILKHSSIDCMSHV